MILEDNAVQLVLLWLQWGTPKWHLTPVVSEGKYICNCFYENKRNLM